MNRELKPGPRPFIGLSLAFSPPLLIILTLAIMAPDGKGIEILKGFGWLIAICGTILFSIAQTRLVIRDDSISETRLLGNPITVPFSQIAHSEVVVLKEKDHPVFLTIFKKPDLKRVTFRLKLYRREDVRWLLSLEELHLKKMA